MMGCARDLATTTTEVLSSVVDIGSTCTPLASTMVVGPSTLHGVACSKEA